MDLATGELGAGLVDGVARVGHEGHVAGVQDGEGEVRQPFLGADQRQDLAVGVEVDAVALRLQNAAIDWRSSGGTLIERVLVKGRVLDVRLEAVDDRPGRGGVGVADAEVDHVLAGGDRGLLLLVDLGEQVRRELLEAVGLRERRGMAGLVRR